MQEYININKIKINYLFQDNGATGVGVGSG